MGILALEGVFEWRGGQNVSPKMVEFSCNGPSQHYILGSNFFDRQIVPTLPLHWSVHEVGLQMNLILKRQLWEGIPASHEHVPCSLTLLTYWLTHNSPPTQKNLTHMQYFSLLWPFDYTRYYLICMTQDPYILFSTIVNLNWQYLTIDDREKSLFKKQKVKSNSENLVTCKC